MLRYKQSNVVNAPTVNSTANNALNTTVIQGMVYLIRMSNVVYNVTVGALDSKKVSSKTKSTN